MNCEKAPSLYVHFPFCETKCHYCDFYSIGETQTRPEDLSTFERALRLESAAIADKLSDKLETVFFGGGTPSKTDVQSAQRALAPLDLSRRCGTETEWTLEMNPATAVEERLRGYRDWGVNRLSMGVQSIRDDILKMLGRAHDYKSVFRSLETAFELGFKNVSIDLILGVPEVGTQELIAAAEQILKSFPLTHFSCYLLTLPPQHFLARKMPTEAIQLEQLALVDELAVSFGFEHYEISNFAKPGFRAKHNMNYWTHKPYLGLGPSAHSYDPFTQKRHKNITALHAWSKALFDGHSPIETIEELNESQLQIEKWMLGLRLTDGVPASWIDGSAFTRQKALSFLQAGWMEKFGDSENPRYRLTPKGFPIADSLLASLI